MSVNVFDVSDETFEADVINRSSQVPVIVDLWAPWCGPCKTLGPIIEKVVDEHGGQVVLAKINVDENPGASQAFQVQGIPAVYALKDGQVVDGFVGAQGEPTVREFIGRLVPSEDELEITRLLEIGDEESLRAILERVADHHVAVPALAEMLVAKGQSQEALDLLARIPETADARRVAAMARVESAPEAPSVSDDYDERLTALLDRVRTDDEARQEYVDLLELMGADDPRTNDYRRQLSARLF